MEKEIKKFRAWDGLNKKFTYWTMNDLCNWDSEGEKPSALDEWEECLEIKDKGGREIYEGDIIFYLFDQGTGEMPQYARVEYVGYGFLPFLSGKGYDGQVVGNIHEDAGLLTT